MVSGLAIEGFMPRRERPSWREARLEIRDAALASAYALLSGRMSLARVASLRRGELERELESLPEELSASLSLAVRVVKSFVRRCVVATSDAVVFASEKRDAFGRVRSVCYASAWRIVTQAVARVLRVGRVERALDLVRGLTMHMADATDSDDPLAGVDLSLAPPDGWDPDPRETRRKEETRRFVEQARLEAERAERERIEGARRFVETNSISLVDVPEREAEVLGEYPEWTWQGWTTRVWRLFGRSGKRGPLTCSRWDFTNTDGQVLLAIREAGLNVTCPPWGSFRGETPTGDLERDRALLAEAYASWSSDP